MNYPRTLLALSLASALLLSGCGAGSGSTSSASSTLTDNTISERSLVQLRIGNEDVILEPEQRYYSWSASDTDSGTEHFDLNTETVIRDWDQETMVTSAGIGLGVSLDYFMDAYHVQPNYAHLNYEYDPYGDGTTDIANEVYTGTLPDWKQKKILDLCISLAYIQEDGQWQLMDQSKQSYSEYEGTCIVYDFDFMEHTEDDAVGIGLDNLTVTYYKPT
ncbi:MAG: hypothetical protein Q4G01_04705 [Eubacteriales bacterium]|nr:hypothetical protein [Eubacteriales bacterium]